VQNGYKLPFITKPQLTSSPPYQRVVGEIRQTWVNVVSNMLDIEAIEEVRDPTSRGSYSHMFLRPKPSGEKRPIINLKRLNVTLNILPFKMSDPRSVLKALQVGDWTTSIDLKDAYCHVPIYKPHRKYLRFAILERVFQFKTLPFGLAPAPQIFTAMVKVLVNWGRSRGINVIAYLDDWLIHASDATLLQSQTRAMVQRARSLGWVINNKKSDLVPKQTFDFIGMEISTVTGTVKPVERRITQMLTIAKTIADSSEVSAKTLMKAQGMMISLGDIIYMGKMNRRPFQEAIAPLKVNRNTSKSWETSPAIKAATTWWTHRENLTREVSFIQNTDLVTIVTDASTVGWGATVMDVPLKGVWTAQETKLHINCLEMLGVKRALEHTRVSLQGKHLALHTDNTTVRAYLLKQGGTVSRKLNLLTAEVWQQICKLNATLSVYHISGSLNVLADKLSRPGQVLHGEWELNQQIFNRLSQVWGKPDIDLFATRFNKKVTTFISPCPDMEAVEQDAMTVNWGKFRLPYAFPPFNLIMQTLEKIRDEHTTCLIVTPAWRGNKFFPLLLSLTTDDPVYLGHQEGVLHQGTDDEIKWYPEPAQLGLHAWIVSGEASRTRDSPRKWQDYQRNHKENPQLEYIPKYGNDSVIGFKPEGQEILSRPLPPE